MNKSSKLTIKRYNYKIKQFLQLFGDMYDNEKNIYADCNHWAKL